MFAGKLDPTMIGPLWQRAENLPGGKWLFSKAIGWMAPYTGTIPFCFKTLSPGHAVVEMRDRRRIRNHLSSIHAIALVNLAEVVSGVALYAGLNPKARGIIVRLSIKYLKKARGTLEARTSFTMPSGLEKTEVPIKIGIYNAANELLAEAEAVWLIAPKRE